MRIRLLIVLSVSLFSFLNGNAQNDSLNYPRPEKMVNKERLNLLVYSTAVIYPVSMYYLYTNWYKDNPQSSFHFFDDSGEWLQMDKAGHVVTSYQVGKACFRALQWADVDDKRAIWYGAATGYFFQTTIEIFDGFSSEWGFSWTDIAANTIGSAALISQQLGWKEQRLQLKYSFHQTSYEEDRPDQLGKGLQENVLKDYNGQTYWLSANISSFMHKDSRFPKWLCFGFGYGVEGLTGGSSNPETDNDKSVPSSDRHRQYYLSLDFDLTKIRTRSKILAGAFKLFNFVHLPAPAIEFNQGHRTKYYWLYF